MQRDFLAIDPYGAITRLCAAETAVYALLTTSRAAVAEIARAGADVGFFSHSLN
jgi:hypothetical protein